MDITYKLRLHKIQYWLPKLKKKKNKRFKEIKYKTTWLLNLPTVGCFNIKWERTEGQRDKWRDIKEVMKEEKNSKLGALSRFRKIQTIEK